MAQERVLVAYVYYHGTTTDMTVCDAVIAISQSYLRWAPKIAQIPKTCVVVEVAHSWSRHDLINL